MEKLYNNIVIGDDFLNNQSDAQNIPYLIKPPEVIDITVGRQLFVDDFLIEKTDLKFVYHKAKKYENNPVLKPETEWETEGLPLASPKSGGVWYDEDEKIFKMWYEASWLKYMCYATSKDGLNWERPDLGLEKGTNKILLYEGYEELKYRDGLKYLRPDSTTVAIDYTCDKSERYKLFMANPGGGEHRAIVAVSEDGINFRDFTYTEKMRDRSTIFYNPFRKKWVYSIRQVWYLEEEIDREWTRARNYRECDNLLEGASWKPEEEHRWMEVDDLDVENPYIRMKPQLYNVDCIAYESIMLGMFQIMYGPDNDVCEKYGVPKITELMPMYSRDGYNYSRPSRESIINASIYKGSWDRGYVQSVSGGVIINGDELFIYYIGFKGDEEAKNQYWVKSGVYSNSATGVAVMRRDGFVSVEGNGILETRKLTMQNKTDMYINAIGNVSVEICDENGNFLARSEVFSGDSTASKLSFENFDVKTLNSKVFRLRFHVEGALYSFGFADENGDFGGAHAAGIVK